MFRKRSYASATTSLVAPGTRVNGDVSFTGTLHVCGTIEGSISVNDGSEGMIVLSAEGTVSGMISVPVVAIDGHVIGDIHATERLELAAQARIEGDVYYRSLEMAAGAQVNGRMVHCEEAPRRLSGPQTESPVAGQDLETGATALK